METSGTKKKMKTGTLVLLSILAVIVIFLIIVLIVVLPWRSAQKKMEFTLINNDTEYMVTSPNLTKSLSGAITGGSNYGGKVVIPSEYNGLPVTVIGEYFMRSTSIKSVTIPDSIKKIGNDAFRSCDKLKVVVMSNSVETIGDHAFSSCFELESIVIPDSVTHIGTEAFHYCNKLSAVTIPESVISIGHLAFVPFETSQACEEENGITYVDKWVVKADETITEAQLREGTVGIADGVFTDCKALKKINIVGSMETIIDSTFANCQALEEVSISNGVKTIGREAFKNCPSLKKVSIPSSVEIIGVSAFEECKALEEISIPEGVKKICGSAFENCQNLKKISIPNSIEIVYVSAFSGCTKLEYNSHESEKYLGNDENRYVVFMGADGVLDDLNIQDGTRVIANGCKLSDSHTVSVPSSVVSIYRDAFDSSQGFYTFNTDPDHVYYGDLSLINALLGSNYASEHLDEVVDKGWLRPLIKF